MALKKYAFKPHLWGAVHVARRFILHTASHWAGGFEIQATLTERYRYLKGSKRG